jgi:hypothetical protein
MFHHNANHRTDNRKKYTCKSILDYVVLPPDRYSLAFEEIYCLHFQGARKPLNSKRCPLVISIFRVF